MKELLAELMDLRLHVKMYDIGPVYDAIYAVRGLLWDKGIDPNTDLDSHWMN